MTQRMKLTSFFGNLRSRTQNNGPSIDGISSTAASGLDQASGRGSAMLLDTLKKYKSEVRMVMGYATEGIGRRITRIVSVTILILIVMIGLSGSAESAITQLDTNGWELIQDSNPNTTNINVTSSTGYTAVVSGTGNRLMLVAFQLANGSTINFTNTPTVTFGGVAVQRIIDTNSVTGGREELWVGYILDANIPAGQQTVNVQVQVSTAATGIKIVCATFDGVDNNAAGGPISFSSANRTTGRTGANNTVVTHDVSFYANEQPILFGAASASTMDSPSTTGWSLNDPPDYGSASVTNSGTIYANNRDIPTADNITGETVSVNLPTRSRYSFIGISLKRISDSTAPTAGAVAATPTSGIYTPASPTITTTFTDAESAVNSCQATSNGSTWSAGTVSGSSPDYTCTRAYTGLTSGATYTFNMSAISTGGTTTATQIIRTVDATAPANGTITGTPGNLKITLDWSGMTDAASGLAPTGTYTVRWAQSATAPANCTAGTLLGTYDDGTLTTNHLGLTNGIPYSYRICTKDAVGNTNTGAIAQNVTPVAGPREVLTSSNTAVATSPQNAGSSIVMQRIQVNSADAPQGAGDAKLELQGLTLNYSGTAASVNDAKVYIDTATTFNAGTAILLGSTGSWNGSSTGVTFGGTQAQREVSTGTPKYLYVVFTTAPTEIGRTVTSNVTAIPVIAPDDGQPSVSYSSNAITLQADPSKLSSCAGCHAYPPFDGTRSGATGAVAGSHQPHNKPAYVCNICHVAPGTETSADFAHRDGTITMQSSIQGGAYSGGSHLQTNTPSLTSCSTNNCHGGAAGNTPTPVWGSGTKPACTSCHNGVVVALNASQVSGGAVTQRDAVVGEFGLAWGHKRTGRGAATDADCIVCHLEGNFTSQLTSTYHADGYIDLRDPDVQGETRITDISGTSFRFVKFATSYNAGDRTSTGHLSNNVDNVLTQKFCIACHDSNGAANTTARTSGGTAAMPFGGVALGANYTAANNAIGTQGLIDVKTQFATTNSSVHPVLGPRNKDYPTAANINDPYKPAGTRGTTGTQSPSVVLNCFDCHNVSGANPLTDRTVVAHGNAETIRGTTHVSNPSLCLSCHPSGSYIVSNQHASGTAFSSGGSSHGSVMDDCHACHGSNTNNSKPARPLPAQDYHGSNALVGGGLWPTVNSRPYAFIRGWTGNAYHRPRRSSEFTTGNPTCGAGTCPTNGQVGDGSTRSYTPGGTY